MTEKCNDIHCVTHSGFKTHGRIFQGTVISAKAQKTVTVEWERKKYIPKYERYEKRRTKVKAHAPECVMFEKGDVVEINECRPISKTKKFVVIKKIEKNLEYLGKSQLIEEAKQKEKKKQEKANSEDK